MKAKIAFISPEQFLSVFECVDAGFPTLRERHATNVLRRVRLVGVPRDVKIGSVRYDESRQAFALYLHHPSFADIPEVQPFPVIPMELETFFCDHEGRTLDLVARIPEDPSRPVQYTTVQGQSYS